MRFEYDLTIVGGSVLDIFLNIGKFPVRKGATVMSPTMLVQPGGASALAMIASRLGLKVAVVDRIGNDPNGSMLIGQMRRAGVEIRHMIREVGSQTAVSINLVDSAGQHSFVGYLANEGGLETGDVDEATIMASRSIFFEGYNLTVKGKTYEAIMKAARVASLNSIHIYFDPGPLIGKIASINEFIGLSRTLFLNTEEARSLARLSKVRGSHHRAPTAFLKGKGQREVVIKRGARGASLVSSGSVRYFPPFKIAGAENTIGAGDAFDAAFIAGKLNGLSSDRACELGNRIAAIRISSGISAIPRWRDL
ncbi:MAG: carbohydrate kinase family protein [Nitrososphaerota archaeon]|nr:carbohydrate kinase family protein [Nitrososphaerota archaeon]MDG7048443.1 carbohydrate kinase family protein [Nitrososphaerota archaeon]